MRTRLETIVARLQSQLDSKLDFVADTRTFRFDITDTDIRLTPQSPQVREYIPTNGIPVLPQALQQFCEKATPSIPWKFMQAMLDQNRPVAERTLNDLLRTDPKRMLVRCLEGNVRAGLSDGYRIADNWDFAPIALDVVRENNGECIEASLTDRHMRLKFTTRQMWDAINDSIREGKHVWFGGNWDFGKRLGWPADRPLPGGPGTVHPLITVTNSETGHGGTSVSIGLVAAWCNNAAIIEAASRSIHLGQRLDLGIFSRETQALEDKAVVAKLRDAIRAGFHPATFARIVNTVKQSAETPIYAPAPAVDQIISTLELPQTKRDEIMAYFCKDYGQNVYGLAQAVSRVAQDTDDADDAELLEVAAGRLMTNPKLAVVPA